MLAYTYIQRGKFELMDKPKPVLLDDRDAIVKVTLASICTSDLHIKHGSVPRAVPGITVFAPCTYDGLKHSFIEAIYHRSGAVAVRYPRGCERTFTQPTEERFSPFEWFGEESADCLLVTYGRLLSEVLRVQETLLARGVSCAVLKLLQITPLPNEAVLSAVNAKDVFFFEEGIRSGGVGESFAARLAQQSARPKFHLTAVPDEFVQHASVDAQLARYGLDYAGMLSTLEENGYGAE